jgi:hypothetical protein
MKKAFWLLAFLSLVIITTGVRGADLIAAWSFDKDTAEKVTDVTGNGFDGVGADTAIVDGKFGKAMEFDGVNSQVEIPHDEVLNIQDAITVEAWVMPTSFIGLGGIAQKWGDNTGRRQYLLCSVNEKVRFYISGSGGTWPSAESGNSMVVDEWVHLAGTYDSQAIKIYFNGELDGETPNEEGLFGSDVPFWIGGYGPNADFGSNRHFPGVIDEVRLWEGAMTDDEVKDVMDKSTAAITAVDASGKLSTTWGKIKDKH